MEHLLLLGLVGGRGLITALLEGEKEAWLAGLPLEWKEGERGISDDLLDRLVEYALEIPLRQGGALEVLDGFDLLGDLHCLLILYGLHLALAQLLFDLWVIAQVELGAHEDDGNAGCVVLYLGVPL
jgi:hypothetical protein